MSECRIELVERFIKVIVDDDPMRAGCARRWLLDGGQHGDRLAGPRYDDALSGGDTCQQLGQMGLGLVYVHRHAGLA